MKTAVRKRRGRREDRLGLRSAVIATKCGSQRHPCDVGVDADRASGNRDPNRPMIRSDGGRAFDRIGLRKKKVLQRKRSAANELQTVGCPPQLEPLVLGCDMKLHVIGARRYLKENFEDVSQLPGPFVQFSCGVGDTRTDEHRVAIEERFIPTDLHPSRLELRLGTVGNPRLRQGTPVPTDRRGPEEWTADFVAVSRNAIACWYDLARGGR